MVSLVISHANVTRIGWHLWEIDLRFALELSPGGEVKYRYLAGDGRYSCPGVSQSWRRRTILVSGVWGLVSPCASPPRVRICACPEIFVSVQPTNLASLRCVPQLGGGTAEPDESRTAAP